MKKSDDIRDAVLALIETTGLVEKLSTCSTFAAERECHPALMTAALVEYYDSVMEARV